MTQEGSASPKKFSRVSQRRKNYSRLTTGNKRVINTNIDIEKSNSHSDEYYETAKVSPTSSYSNSIYSKGISHLKSSQS